MSDNAKKTLSTENIYGKCLCGASLIRCDGKLKKPLKNERDSAGYKLLYCDKCRVRVSKKGHKVGKQCGLWICSKSRGSEHQCPYRLNAPTYV